MAFTAEQSFQFLKAAFDRKRLPHALLLNDNQESEAFIVASKLVRYINRLPENASLESEYCKIIRAKSKSRRILVDDIRELEPFFQKKALGHAWKIGIFPEADCLNEQAANAFLKTLEEPPAQSLIILITSHPEQLMQTIRSRCVRLDLYSPQIKYVLSDTEKAIIPAWINACRHLGSESSALAFRGELSLLFSKLKQSIKERYEEEVKETSRQMAKTSGVTDWEKQMEDITNALITTEYLNERDRLFDFFIAWFGDALRQTAKAPAPQFPEYKQELDTLIEKVPLPELMIRIEAIEKLKADLKFNVQETLALDVYFLKILG